MAGGIGVGVGGLRRVGSWDHLHGENMQGSFIEPAAHHHEIRLANKSDEMNTIYLPYNCSLKPVDMI